MMYSLYFFADNITELSFLNLNYFGGSYYGM